MVSAVLIPLQYLFYIWRAQQCTAKAAAAGGTGRHAKYLDKAAEATLAAEILQRRFPAITNRIDIRRNEQALRFEMRK